LVEEEDEQQRQLHFTVDRADRRYQISGGPVNGDYEVGDHGQVPLKMLVKLTGSKRESCGLPVVRGPSSRRATAPY
jgi:hypothetical protein